MTRNKNKILLLLFGLLVGLPLAVTIVFMFPGVQTRVVSNITRRLSHDLNTEISIGRIQALPFSGIRINDFLIRDLNRDTLLFSPSVHAEVDYFSFLKKHFYIGRITINAPQINLTEHDKKMNFAFLIDSIGANRPDTSKWHYSVRGINIKDGSISLAHSVFQNPDLKKHSFLFNNVNLDIERTSGVADSLNFRINNLSLEEKAGLSIQSCGAEGKIRPDKVSVKDFFLKTPFSEINISRLEIPVNPEKNKLDDNQRFLTKIRKIYLSPEELGLYLKNIPQIETSIGLSGQIYGSSDNLKGRGINLTLGRETRINLSFDISDLSDYKETFLFIDIENLETTPSDLFRITGRSEDLKGGNLPALGTIRYTGNLTGFTSDMVAYGSFNTALGNISTDIGVKFEEDKSVSYKGGLKTIDFKLGEILNDKSQIGNLTMNVDVNGVWKDKSHYFSYLTGKIKKFEWNEYLYRDIDINGLLTHQRFDGSVRVDDDNGSMAFDGKFDLAGTIPRFRFRAFLENVMADRLNILPNLKDGVITMTIGADFEGDNLDNLAGEVNITEGLIFTPNTSLEIDTLSLKAFKKDSVKRMTLRSDFVEADLTGQYNFANFRQSFVDMISHFLPALVPPVDENEVPANIFKFNVDFNGFDKVIRLFSPDLEVAGKGKLNGTIDSKKQIFDINASFDNAAFKSITAKDIEFYANTRGGDDLQIVTRAREIDRNNALTLYNFSIHQKARQDTLDMNIFWNNWHEVTNSGAIYSTSSFRKDEKDDFYFTTHLHPSTVILRDSIWNINEAKISRTPNTISIEGLEIKHDRQRLALNGFLHRKSMDGLRLEMDNIDLSQLFKPNNEKSHHFGGLANGNIELKNYYRTPLWTANFSIDDFSFDGDTAGFLTIASQWDQSSNALAVSTSLKDGEKTPLAGEGHIFPEENNINIDLDLNGFNASFLGSFIGNILQNFSAGTSGELHLTGPLNKPLLTGKVNIDSGRFDVDLLQTSYILRDSVWFYPNEIRFKDVEVEDKFGKTGRFRGSIYHTGFSDMVFNLQLDVNNQLVLDTKAKDNPYYYGTVYGTGKMLVNGTSQNTELTISCTTEENTRFFIPTADTDEAVQSNFIRFISGKDQQEDPYNATPEENGAEYKVDLSGLELNMDIDVTPAARIEIIFDAATGDVLTTTGSGNIQIHINQQGNLSLFGEYMIEEGEYLFSLQNLVNKRFQINQGGTVTWQGDPYKAQIDLTAVYKLKAPLSDLIGPITDTGTGENQDIYRRIPIHCNLMLSGPLEEPGIKFGIETPTLSESRENYILDFITSEEEMNRQVLSLLVLNRFYTPDYLRMENTEGMQTNNAALVTTTEMLSNQLSRWLSNISNEFDVGVSYRPEDNISSEEIEVALSTQMFNNRVTINGNVGYGKYQTNTSKMVGDFDMDVKLNKSGTIRAKAYTRSNDDIIYETSPTTQGIGISFKEEFDKFTELLSKYWKAITGRKDEED
ncbi:MAG: hypothetical protein PWQ06_1846 [Anaerophaga sp.]|nr:hypothetical protein [Anaerophaga sp.]